MAETKDDVDINMDEGGGSKTKLIIIAVVVLILAGVAGFMLTQGDAPSSEQTGEEQNASTKKTAIYYSFKAPFVINFKQQSDNAVKYLQIKLKVMARDQKTIDAVSQHLPAIQHELLILFFEQNYEALMTQQGTKALRQKTLENLNALLAKEGLTEELEAVYFTSLIMQ